MTLFLTSCSSKQNTLTIATAANMQFAMDALVEAFEIKNGTDCEVILGSSGKLTAQIQEGAPYDLFFSADLKYPQALVVAGKTFGPPLTYAYGQLVLWSTQEDLSVSLETLSDPKVQHVAIANPKTAPYGLAAEEVLKGISIYESLIGKLVFGESISQVNQFVITGAAEIGFTAKSVVLSPNMMDKGQWVSLPDSLYSPIAQAMVILQNDRNLQKEAQAFADFVMSDEGQAILERFGYKTDF